MNARLRGFEALSRFDSAGLIKVRFDGLACLTNGLAADRRGVEIFSAWGAGASCGCAARCVSQLGAHSVDSTARRQSSARTQAAGMELFSFACPLTKRTAPGLANELSSRGWNGTIARQPCHGSFVEGWHQTRTTPPPPPPGGVWEGASESLPTSAEVERPCQARRLTWSPVRLARRPPPKRAVPPVCRWVERLSKRKRRRGQSSLVASTSVLRSSRPRSRVTKLFATARAVEGGLANPQLES